MKAENGMTATPVQPIVSPFYDRDGITIYCGDARDILPALVFDAILTDPPYPNYKEAEYHYQPDGLECLRAIGCPQAIFWTPCHPFPLDWRGMICWDKAAGNKNSQFEIVYQRNWTTGAKLWRYMTPHNSVRANWCGDVCNEHPSQKPIQLMKKLVAEFGDVRTICDPFCGSGSTLLAAKLAGVAAIGIEVERKWCEIAVQRLRQGVLDFGSEG